MMKPYIFFTFFCFLGLIFLPIEAKEIYDLSSYSQGESEQTRNFRYFFGYFVMGYFSLLLILWFIWSRKLHQLVLRRYDRYDLPHFPVKKDDKPSVSNDS